MFHFELLISTHQAALSIVKYNFHRLNNRKRSVIVDNRNLKLRIGGSSFDHKSQSNECWGWVEKFQRLKFVQMKVVEVTVTPIQMRRLHDTTDDNIRLGLSSEIWEKQFHRNKTKCQLFLLWQLFTLFS